MKPSLEELREAVRDRMRGYHARGSWQTFYIGPPKEWKQKTMNTYKITDAIQTLAEETDTDYIDILEALVGYCWSKEEASEIKNAYNQ